MTSTAAPDPAPTIGRIVHFRSPTDPVMAGVGGDWHLAAIVTMTPEEWTPGYRDGAGEWHETVGVAQPKVGTVHLHVFVPPSTPGTNDWKPEQIDVHDVPYGSGAGTWSWPPRV